MIFCSSPGVRHFHVVFFWLFFLINVQLHRYHKFLKVTNSSPDASDGLAPQFMFLHDWKVRTPPPPPPPHTHTHTQQKRQINRFSSIAGNLSISNQKIFSGNIQQSFCRYLYPGICICSVFSTRIPHKSYKSAVTYTFTYFEFPVRII